MFFKGTLIIEINMQKDSVVQVLKFMKNGNMLFL